MYQNWLCLKCGNSNESEVKGPDLIVDDVSEEYLDGIRLLFFSNNKEMKIKHSVLGDTFRCEDYYKTYKKIPTEEEVFEFKLACMLESNFNSIAESIKFVTEEMNLDDLMLIEHFEETYKYGVRPYIVKNCSHCDNKEVQVKYNFSVLRFFPDYNSKSTLQSRTLSNKTSPHTTVGDTKNGLRESSLSQESTSIDSRNDGDGTKQVEIAIPKSSMKDLSEEAKSSEVAPMSQLIR